MEAISRMLEGPLFGEKEPGPAAALVDRVSSVRALEMRLSDFEVSIFGIHTALCGPQGTAELLMGPDWGVNMELVDLINMDTGTCV